MDTAASPGSIASEMSAAEVATAHDVAMTEYDPSLWDEIEKLMVEQISRHRVAMAEQISRQKETLASVRSLRKKATKELRRVSKGGIRKKAKRDSDAAPAGFNVPVEVNQEFAALLGLPLGTPMARKDITKAINRYVTSNNLKNPEMKREFMLHLPQASHFVLMWS